MKGKIVALDYGAKRIGVAITDPDQTVCFPRTVWEGHSKEEVIQALKTLVSEEGVVKVIIGWPLNLMGEETRQTQKTAQFVEQVKKELPIPVEILDERFTSILAAQRGGDDAVAAQILLESYLASIIQP